MGRAGVFRKDGFWIAFIYIEGKHLNLGHFDNEKKAARAYDTAAKERREDAIVNFLPVRIDFDG